MSTLMGMNEKLKRQNSVELTNEQIYKSLVNFLIYLTNTRPASVVSRYMNKHSKIHLMAIMKILKYVKGKKIFGVKYEVENVA